MNKKIFSNDSYFEPMWGAGATGLTTTKEGYLRGRICVTGAGVYKYYGKDGKTRYRLRSVDEVSKATEGLNGIPLTLRHPDELVNKDNVKAYTIGYTGTDASFDGLNNFVTVTITDAKAIEEVRSGKVKSVSCGYEHFVLDESGNWQGVDYDQVQTGIEYNHVALVFEGRAGDGVRFRVNDSVDLWNFEQDNSNKGKIMRKISMDGVEYEADEAVINALKVSQKDASDKQKALDAMTAERDAAKASCDAKDKEIATLKDAALDEKAIADKVNARIALVKAADERGIEKAMDMSDKELKAAIIGKAFEGVSLDGKSEDYINAMFDAAVATKVNSADNSIDGNKNTSDDSKDYSSDEAVEKAQAEYAARMRGEGGK